MYCTSSFPFVFMYAALGLLVYRYAYYWFNQSQSTMRFIFCYNILFFLKLLFAQIKPISCGNYLIIWSVYVLSHKTQGAEMQNGACFSITKHHNLFSITGLLSNLRKANKVWLHPHSVCLKPLLCLLIKPRLCQNAQFTP